MACKKILIELQFKKEKNMLKELFYTYQKDLNNENKFRLLTKKLTPKILSIFKTVNCSYDLKDDFIQECYFKIYTIAIKNEYFFCKRLCN